MTTTPSLPPSPPNSSRSGGLVIGVLALQGAFIEHVNILLAIPMVARAPLVRQLEDLEDLDALIIPGGESTTIALIAQRSGIWEALRDFGTRRPVWGTCAGLILLSEKAENTKKGGQELLGLLPITVLRNRFGSQTDSFETHLSVPVLGQDFLALFIRAPVIESVREGEGVEVMAKLENGEIVAVRKDDILGCAFHPELTGDRRWHQYFVGMAGEARERRSRLC
ncbi:PdxT/SNO family [Piptocephalis cylindrospora]|uniref:glutaminase n=1 Tax=Piptocephalis cylindrospora TaxID=1907219 RepID=A0A4P9XZ97_9FUNG|nr:PdxT/SNO family [Piptocephalis cylindrospora]|eukprot:RKP11452.1 PdxT/SNO family [Piptocephalis cylindrospora]